LPLFEVLSECCAIVKPQAQMKNIHLHVLQNEEPPAVYADRIKLKQVLGNLLSNALKHTESGGQVTIEWKKNPPGRVRITDTGIGISPEKIEQLFESYSRSGQEEGPEEGMGIGLAAIKKLVEMMDGTIGVTSTEGGGSTFWIELRASEAG
jgi:signal transduction histidine kinase